jgi:protoporphyrinogen/coproporphyrinogen III oxidase
MKSVAIIGAGITGLTAAHELRKRAVPVTVYEASRRAGGVIRTVQRDGFMAECGPNTLLETSPAIPALFRELGLDALYSDPAAKNKYIIRGGRPVALPSSPVEFFASPLFSLGAKLRLLKEPFIPRSAPEAEESLGAFVVRRLGTEFLDYAINPFVAGVYAGDPWKLSVREAFGKVYELEQRYGSLIGGQILGARERKKRGGVSKQNAPKVSFAHGLSTVTEALALRLGEEVRLGTRLERLEETREGWRLELGSDAGRSIADHSAVILCAPAFALGDLPFSSGLRVSLDFLKQVRYAPVSSAALGYRRDQVDHPLDGFGFLVPEVERLNILGAIFSSSLFPGRAPDGHVLISCYLGGLRSPELPFADVDEQIALVRADLEKTIGARGQPVFAHHACHPRAIPQYEIGYAKIRREIEAAEIKCPGLFFGGNYHRGVSLGDSLLNGLALGTRAADFIRTSPQAAPEALLAA